jgi:hypothetical protein
VNTVHITPAPGSLIPLVHCRKTSLLRSHGRRDGLVVRRRRPWRPRQGHHSRAVPGFSNVVASEQDRAERRLPADSPAVPHRPDPAAGGNVGAGAGGRYVLQPDRRAAATAAVPCRPVPAAPSCRSVPPPNIALA